MSINDRLRVRFYASTSEGRTYGHAFMGSLNYGDIAWTYGEQLWGDFDYGRWIEQLMPNGEPLNCLITSLSMDLGRQRILDQNRIGMCSIQVVQMDLPNDWINEDYNSVMPAAVVLGRTIVIESMNNGTWSAVFTGTVEQAECQLQGTGNYNQPTLKWEILAVDSLNKLRRIQEAPGTTWRAEEDVSERLEFIAERANLGVRYLETTPGLECHPSEFETNLLDEAQNVAKHGYRLAASQDGSDIDVELMHLDTSFGALAPSVVWISSPYEIWPIHLYGVRQRMMLPCPTETRVVWPMDRLINQVTILTPDVPTDPTPEDYIRMDLVSIADFGRRTYQDSLPMVEAAGVQTPALTLANQILNAYKDPTPYLTSISMDFTLRIDMDTVEPTVDFISSVGTFPVGFAYAMRMLRGTRVIAVTLPPTDANRIPWATGYVIGVTWKIDAVTAKCDVHVESKPDLYGSQDSPTLELEPTHPTELEGLGFATLEYPQTDYAQLSFNIPVTVNPLDVEVVLDFYDPGQAYAYFLRSPTTLSVPRVEWKVDTDGRLKLWGLNAAGTAVYTGVNQPYSVGTARTRYYSRVSGSFVKMGILNPGDSIPAPATSVSTAISSLWFAVGSSVVVGWQGSSGQYSLYGYLFDLKIRTYSTQEILLHVRPEDWIAGSWVDPYGNVITVTQPVQYSNDLPAYLEE